MTTRSEAFSLESGGEAKGRFADVTLKRDLTGYALYALNANGTRGASVPLSVKDGKTSFALTTATALAYELVRND